MNEPNSAAEPSPSAASVPAVPSAPSGPWTSLPPVPESGVGSAGLAGLAQASAEATVPVPPENVGRGAALALVTVPVGVVAWVIIWQLGFIAAIVALGVSVLASLLYAKGAGGRVSRIGIAVILGITLGTLALAFVAGLVSDVLPLYTGATGIDGLSALLHPGFWNVFGHLVTDSEASGTIARDAVIAAAAAAVGVFGTLRRLVKGQ